MHDPHPVRLVVEDDLGRSRLTVFFRLLLVIPHLVWFVVWSLVVFVASIFGWLAALLLGRLPDGLHRFFCSYIRYTTHLISYFTLVANPYPGFTGLAGSYPVDVQLPDAGPQPRWSTFARLLLAIPALVLTGALGGGGSSYSTTRSPGGSSTFANATTSGLSGVTALLGWFASVFTARMPRGLRDAGAYSLGYRAQMLAYLLLVTPRYPYADPTELLAELERPPLHPVHIVGDAGDLRRSRATVLFRLLLAIPHLVWLALWAIVAFFAAIAQWFVTLVRGTPAVGLHAFLSRYVRYQFHVYAYLFLVANPFPGFTGLAGSYPIDLELPGPERQDRWKTAFRVVLAIPAFAVSSALATVLVAASILSWFASVAKGSAPEGLRNVSAYAVRYGGQANGYFFLLTDVYPHSSPLEGASPGDTFEAPPALAGALG